MIDRINPQSRSDAYGSKINRAHSPFRAYLVPYLSILLGSLLPTLLIASAVPLVPPLGFLLFVGWRLVRPGLLPMWAGIPLGLFDDLFSGQPFGFGMFAWSLAMLAIEAIETRFPWRGMLQDLLTATGLVTAYILGGALFSGGTVGAFTLYAILPQFLLSIATIPIVGRIVAWLDRMRLMRRRVA